MNNAVYIPLLIVMLAVTYLIRALPFLLFRKRITNRRVKAFLEYIPYTVLTSMTFPSILFSTGNIIAASVALVVAMLLAWRNKSLLTVAIGTCAASFIVNLIMTMI